MHHMYKHKKIMASAKRISYYSSVGKQNTFRHGIAHAKINVLFKFVTELLVPKFAYNE